MVDLGLCDATAGRVPPIHINRKAHLMKRALANPFRKERRSPSWRRMTAKLALVASLLFGSLMAAPGAAHAADYWTCGHRIITTYNQGWIRVAGMSGIAGRNDIRVVGPISAGGGYAWADVSIHDAINLRLLWASFQTSQIIFVNNPECNIAVV
jgi:hypothetical protein